MARLSVNIDHVATVRQARRTWEPDPVRAAAEAVAGGADGITVHLREDRRHIQDADVARLRESLRVPLNLEMAPTPEMVAIALATRPETVMLVPEGRHEITTEGGLDVHALRDRLRAVIEPLRSVGIPVSAFIDAEERQVAAAASLGIAICEVHTGPYAHAFHAEGTLGPRAAALLDDVQRTGQQIIAAGMRFNAGHALHLENVAPLARCSGLWELHIGHAIVSRAIFVGMRAAVAEMRALCSSP
ncbi:MAG: pyridoxine 5'-phosphate synthase [Planctomycetes bacterium]|nr:pyridoxine 5'-phosphate synthase [Planctomycetota bacterium]